MNSLIAPRPADGDLSVAGRCTVAGKEFPCTASLADAGSVHVACSHLVTPDDIGTEVIAYLDGIGMVAGPIRASSPTGFTVSIVVGEERRARIVRRLAWLRAHRDGAVEVAERRGDPRLIPHNRVTTLRWPDGSSSAAEIIDLSMSGAGLALAQRPEVGWSVTVGKRIARVVRHTEDGIGVAFALPFSPQTFDEHAVP